MVAAAAAPFSVLDDRVDPSLARRIETKFRFERQDVSSLRSVLLRAGRAIRHAGPVSTVRSIYFDDARLSDCRANLDGIGVRNKTRLRWYDHETPMDRFFAEIKWRRYQVTGKHRFAMAGGQGLASVSLASIPGRLVGLLPDRFGAILARAMQAVALVEYRREHFALGAARLTLDYDMRFYPLLGRRRLTRRFGERLPGIALIECKTAVGDVPPLRSLLRSLQARPARFSKYVTACQRLGFVSSEGFS